MELLNKALSGETDATFLVDNDKENREVYTFSFGLPGFESLTKFILREVDGFTPFKILHSFHDPTVAFLMIDHKKILSRDLVAEVKEALEKTNPPLKPGPTTCIYVVLQYNREKKGFTANLRAPIVIDDTRKTGAQIILDRQSLPMNYELIRK